MIYNVKRLDKELNMPTGGVYVDADDTQEAIAKGKDKFVLEIKDHHILEACERPDLRCCLICKKIYDPKQLKRSQGDVYWLNEYCGAGCYTKSIPIRKQIAADIKKKITKEEGITITSDKNSWNSGLEDNVIRPIAKLAIERYGDFMIENLNKKEMNLISDDHTVRKMEAVINGHNVRLIRNNILYRDFYKDVICPESKDAKYMINIEVGVPSGENTRWFVGIYYLMKDGKWVDETELKELTTYE